jgi:hypothetical protein
LVKSRLLQNPCLVLLLVTIATTIVPITSRADELWPAGQVTESLPGEPLSPPSQAVFAPTSEVITLTATDDTFVASDAPFTNWDNYQISGINLFLLGYYKDTQGILRGLVKFDASPIPPGSTLENVTMYVYMAAYWQPAPTATLRAYRVTSPWAEGDATWNNMGEVYGEAYGSTDVGTAWGWYGLDVTDLVRTWLTGVYPNYGIMLRGREGHQTSLKGFLTHEQGVDWAPHLVVQYTPEATPPVSRVESLPSYSRAGKVTIRWSGEDDASGIDYYDVQYRDGAGGSWQDWLATDKSQAVFDVGLAGHTHYFRCRAIDKVGNVEDWPADADAQTTLYTFQLTGALSDNRGGPVSSVAVEVGCDD